MPGGIGRRALGGASLLLASGCSPAAVLNDLAPERLVARDIRYAPGNRHRLDIYAPAEAARAPVVLFLYGGNWDSGNRAMYRFVGGALASSGIVTVIPDYRLYPSVRYPDFLQDCAAALRWTRDNIARHGGAPDRLFVMGHSAGAYNAAMLALDPRFLAAVGMQPKRDLSGGIGLAGPYDFLPLHDPELEAIFAPAGDLVTTQPITYADGDNPPMLLLAGQDDTTVRPGNTLRLADRIRGRGGFVEDRIYPGIDHIEIIGAIAAPLRFLAPTLRDCRAFIGAA